MPQSDRMVAALEERLRMDTTTSSVVIKRKWKIDRHMYCIGGRKWHTSLEEALLELADAMEARDAAD